MICRLKRIEPSLVATLDVLGTTRMMNTDHHESLTELAYSLEKAFNQASENISRIQLNIAKGARKDLPIQKFFKIRVFSDTIVLCCDFGKIIKQVPVVDRMSCPEYLCMIFCFFVCVKSLALSLFYEGFPTRGCIAAGPIITTKSFILGKPFVESMAISKDLQFAGIVLTDGAKLVYNTIATKFHPLIDRAPIELHNVHCKSRYRKRLWCLNFLDSPNDKFLITDMPFLFSEHGKTITEDVQEKITNTTQLLKAFLRKVKW